MPAPKGHQRWGGRAKGTPNKSTQKLLDICEKYKIIPFEAMIKIALEEKDPREAFAMWDKISNYVHPKRRPEDSDGNAGQDKDDIPRPGLTFEEVERLVMLARGKV